jgi:hypothetical protein
LFNFAEAQNRQIAKGTALYSIQTNVPPSCVGSRAEIFTAVKIDVVILCVVTTVRSSRSLFFYYYYFLGWAETESTWYGG